MAFIARQPFAPLDGARLQSLTSLNNRQNALTSPSNIKRKAELLGTEDFENVDPLLSAKRSKGASGTPTKDMLIKKPSAHVLIKAAVTPNAHARALTSPIKASTAPRRTLQPKSPINKLNTHLAKSSPLSAPAGRSPTGGKRSGLLSSRRQTAGPYARVDPPLFALDSAAPFSLDAALKGTIPSYASPDTAQSNEVANEQDTFVTPPVLVRPRSNALSKASSSISSSLAEPDSRTAWFFEIHEDTPEQEMTNLLQHSTCVLDISSDEENERKARRERAEGRDKENIPPSDDVSQTSSRRSARAAALDDMTVEKERIALREIEPADYLATGSDATSLIIMPGDYEEEPLEPVTEPAEKAPVAEESLSTLRQDKMQTPKVIDQRMATSERGAGAALLQPIEGTGESFELWESSSAKDDAGL
ncbi:hypothetical protein E4U41_007013 [Claviceps citrina]|nr:hypothetical protein E4U41_007013 [Claviceps citrina]